jgi:capsular polysaccharide biosynthesis protein
VIDAARDAGWRLTRGRRALLEDLDAVLVGRRRPRIAVVGEQPRPREPGGMRGVLATVPNARLHHVEEGVSASQLHARLAAEGRFDVIVVDSASSGPAPSRLHEVIFHLRRGGAVFLRFPPGKPATVVKGASSQRWSQLGGLLDYLTGSAVSPPYIGVSGREEGPLVTRGRMLADRRVLSEAIGQLRMGHQHVMAVNQVPALAKMREHEMDHVLRLRPARFGRVLETVPGGRFQSRCVSRQSTERPVEPIHPTYNAPPVSLREYTNVICLPQQVARQRNLLLPDTFRKNDAPRLMHSRLEETSERFARPLDRRTPTPLPGTYYYLDSEFPGHFGHALTEQLSRLWALPVAQQAHPNLKVLMSRRPSRRQLTTFERQILAAAGLADDDIVLVDRPVHVDRLLAATPMFSAPDYVHPGIEAVWARVGDVLVASAPDRLYPARVFCSRRAERRPCHNRSEVEALFAALGFAVVYPEDLPFVEQARMFREADVIAGFAGSALLSLVFSRRGKHVIVLSTESYAVRNEHLICSVLGHPLDVVWSKPDVNHPEGGWDRDAFRAGFTFDFDREGLFLAEVLASLD